MAVGDWKVSPDEEAPELVNPCVICRDEEGDESGVCFSCERDALEFAASFIEVPERIQPQSEKRIQKRMVA
jgi:hypothetical protein